MTHLDRTRYYCPACRERREKGQDLCPICGDPCRKGGFCPICEETLLLPIGSDCPKHDVELLDPDSEELTERPEVNTSELVVLRVFNNSAEANALRIRLESEGIPTFLDSERMGSNSFYAVATGGVKLMVPRDLTADARILLDQIWSLPKAEPADDEDLWDELGPEIGSGRRAFMKATILFLLIYGPIISFISFVIFDRIQQRIWLR